MKQFRVNLFNVIIDSASSAARNRFGQNENILQDIAFLDPQNFSLCREGIPEDRLHTLADLAEVNRKDLCAWLTAFAEHFDGIVNRKFGAMIQSVTHMRLTKKSLVSVVCVRNVCLVCFCFFTNITCTASHSQICMLLTKLCCHCHAHK